MSLSERRSRILALIVDDFVGSAQPVGSQALVERHRLGLSSATIRNEMAALEDEGMITHPHTSAGRIPSHRGYRYYVSSLMPERALTPQEQFTILHQFHQASRDLEEWIGLAASVLANHMRNVALVTQPRLIEVRLKHLQLVELLENRALLVAVTNDSGVHQRTIDFSVPVHQEQLSRLAARLNAEFGGKAVAEFPARDGSEPLSQVEASVIAALTDLLLKEQAAQVDAPIVEGVREMLRQPEFGQSDRMLDTLDAVEERKLRQAIPTDALSQPGVAVVIGDENREGPYQDMSFVLARYGPEGGAGGIVGILGPTRMQYGDAVAHVRYVSDVLTELIREFYGEVD
ncbi:MAG: heat-inducible transcription repressor HrcA [Dehalococcoidia bacterium]|jgi:heat-inducible transcriptional repressor|nr:heat-inducible transcriptional repressor HrcA [Tepidiformaceae bacterium]